MKYLKVNEEEFWDKHEALKAEGAHIWRFFELRRYGKISYEFWYS